VNDVDCFTNRTTTVIENNEAKRNDVAINCGYWIASQDRKDGWKI